MPTTEVKAQITPNLRRNLSKEKIKLMFKSSKVTIEAQKSRNFNFQNQSNTTVGKLQHSFSKLGKMRAKLQDLRTNSLKSFANIECKAPLPLEVGLLHNYL